MNILWGPYVLKKLWGPMIDEWAGQGMVGYCSSKNANFLDLHDGLEKWDLERGGGVKG